MCRIDVQIQGDKCETDCIIASIVSAIEENSDEKHDKSKIAEWRDEIEENNITFKRTNNEK